jgi:hypothetical protein
MRRKVVGNDKKNDRMIKKNWGEYDIEIEISLLCE